MKKVILGVMAIILAFSLVACNERRNNTLTSGDSENQEVINQENSGNQEQEITGNKTSGDETEIENESGEHKVSNFDLSFLKLENEKENKIYSPLSIKYALKMLEEGTSGDTKLQISNVIGDYKLTKYNSNENMSLANALFVKDSFENEIKEQYRNRLINEYGAEVIFDSFETPDNVNSWISDKTLNLINNLVDDIENEDFILVNALGIDMEWKGKFLTPSVENNWSYAHEKFHGSATLQVSEHEFGEEKQIISGMEIEASINNYDIVSELGEENIRKIVGDEFKKWAKSLTEDDWEYESYFNNDLSDENIEKELNLYLNGNPELPYSKGYIAEIDSNYGREDYSTDFSLYVDDDIKVFAKDLKEYEGTTLQYVGIMPINESLDSYIANLDDSTINHIISNLRDLRLESFKEGVVTKITGYIPKFKFEYDLKLKDDLKQLGITSVFEQGKANLTEISENDEVYITDAKHKANIEFTQDGIKAAAATVLYGAGAGSSFDYLFDVPVEEIDLTFDKPFMFLIRDKETGEIWFIGTVYEPLLWENEPEKDNDVW